MTFNAKNKSFQLQSFVFLKVVATENPLHQSSISKHPRKLGFGVKVRVEL
jgi:hypothetical protein